METDLSKIEKMPYQRYTDWSVNFAKNRNTTYKHLRFGQAFMNDNFPHVVCPKLFYEEDLTKASGIITASFVDWSIQ